MPAGQGKDAERFAAAVDARTPLVAADDAELARDLEIVAMLRSRGAAYAPDPETKARAKQRLMAALAAEQGPGRVSHPAPQDGAPRSAVAPPAEAELTAPLGRLGDLAARDDEDVDPTAETTLMAPVTARLEIEAEAGTEAEVEPGEDATSAAAPSRPSRASRKARHRMASRPAGGPRSARRPAATGLRRRALLVASAAMVAMVVIASGGVFASRDALPGDSLYPVKQVAETAGLALTFDDAGRARRQLEIAATRLSEVEKLTARDGGTAPAPEVFAEAMDEFDAATDEGSRLLLESAGEPETGEAAASDLRAWATEQSERLAELRPALPPTAEADDSIALLDRLLARTGGSSDEGRACEDDECDSRGGSDADARESGEADATEDATPTPEESDSPDTSETNEDEPSRTLTPTRDGEDRLLPDLLPNRERDGEDDTTSSNSSEDEDTTSTSEAESESDDKGGDDNVDVPLPLLPPVTLPPLLPGMPGITLG